MFLAEAALLQACQDKLIADLQLNIDQCQVVLDGELPATAPTLFVAVSPGGISPGPRHRSSGGAIDILVSVKVTVYRRIAEQPRDRRRSMFVQMLAGIAPTCELVARALDNDYALINAATADIEALIAEFVTAPAQLAAMSGGTFQEPFRQFNPELSPRLVFRDAYDAAQMAGPPASGVLAIARSMTFQGARFMQVRSTWAQS